MLEQEENVLGVVLGCDDGDDAIESGIGTENDCFQNGTVAVVVAATVAVAAAVVVAEEESIGEGESIEG